MVLTISQRGNPSNFSHYKLNTLSFININSGVFTGFQAVGTNNILLLLIQENM